MNLARLSAVAVTVTGSMLAACGDTAKLSVADGTGPQPRWVAPHPTLIPTVNIAPARGWPAGATPQAAEGTRVVAFASGTHRVYASGLRNPNGLAWAPDGALWTVVNERDEIGSDLVPDYLTSVRDGAFYGWP